MTHMPVLSMRFAGAAGIIAVLIAAAGMLAGDETPSASAPPAQTVSTEKANDKSEAGKRIFEKILKAHGGRENLLKIQDSKLSIDYRVMPQGIDMMAVYYMKLPDRLRIDLHGTWTKVYDGKEGWGYIDLEEKFKSLAGDALVEFKDSARAVQGLLNPDALNISPVLEGRAPVDGKDYLLIRYDNYGGFDTVYVLVDPDTFLPYISTSLKSGAKTVVINSDYREVEGLKLPFLMQINIDEERSIQMTVREWKLNAGMADALFTKKSVKALKKSGQGIDLTGFIDEVPAPELVRKVAPVLPELARRARFSGTVVLRITINEEGLVRDVRIVSGHPLLTNAAIDAVRQWRYNPTVRNGKPVPVTITVPVKIS